MVLSFCYLSLHMSFCNALLLFCVLCTLPFRVILIHIHRIFILNMAWPFKPQQLKGRYQKPVL